MKRSMTLPMLQIFDAPDTATSCAAARKFDGGAAGAGDDEQRVQRGAGRAVRGARSRSRRATIRRRPSRPAWKLAFGRPPAAEERKTALDYLKRNSLPRLVPFDLQHERVYLCRLTEFAPRSFCRHAGLGIGWLAAARHVPADGMAAAARESAGSEGAAVAGHCEARDLAVHAGRTQPGGHVRSEAAARPSCTGSIRPTSFGNEDFQNGKFRESMILGSKRTFKKYGQSGIEVSDLLPHIAEKRR